MLLDDARQLAKNWGLPQPDAVRAPLPGAAANAVRLRFAPAAEIYLIAGDQYPDLPPHAVINWGDAAAGTFASLDWNIQLEPEKRLEAAFRAYIDPPGPYHAAWGPRVGSPATMDPGVALNASWVRFLTGKPLIAPQVQERVQADVVAALAASHVLAIGLGSVGSYMAEQLVRSGLGGITLIDPDKVEPGNLSRTVYTLRDIGHNKARALSRRLLEINPALDISIYEKSFEEVGGDRLRNEFRRASLVLATTDDHRTQTRINRCAFYADRPACYTGLYRGAKGGEAILAVPGVTPCFNCIAASRPRSLEQEGRVRETDYGTGRLTGEIALGCDIQHVASAAVKISISLLAALNGREAASTATLALQAMKQGLALATFGSEVDYWPSLYGEVFRNTPGQHAFQSVWISASSDLDCEICGTHDVFPDDPFQYLHPDPNLSNLRRCANAGA